jgi:type I restriction enzyme M protein
MARTGKTTDQPQTTAQSLGSLLKTARDIMRKDKGLNGDLDRLPMLTWIMFLKFLDDLESQREEEVALARKKFRPAIEPPYRWRDWASRPQGVTGDELLAFINQEECIRPDGSKGPGLFAYLRKLTSANGDDRRDVIATVFSGVQNRMVSGYLLRDVINKVAGIHFTATSELHTLGALYETMLREMRDAAGDSGEFYTPRAVVRFMVAVTDPQLDETVLDPASGTGGFLVEALSHLSRQVKTVADHRTLQERTLLGCEPKPLPYLLCQMNLLLHGLDAPRIDPGNALRFKLTEIGEKDRVDVILTNPPFGGEEEKGIQGNFPDDKQTAETALLFLQLIMRKLRRRPTPADRSARAAVVVPESVMSDKGVAARIREELICDFNLHTVVRLPKGVFEPYSDIQTNLLFFDRSGTTEGVWFFEHEVPIERRNMQNPCYTQSIPLRFEELQPILDWWQRRESSAASWYVEKKKVVEAGYTFDFRNPRKQAGQSTTVQQIISNLEGPLGRAVDLLGNVEKNVNSEQPIISSNSEKKPLNLFLVRTREESKLEDSVIYKQITVRLYGKGAVLRKTLLGVEIKTRPQFVARAGQLIMSRIDARNGAFAIVPIELDGAVVTQDFPLFNVNRDVVYPEFLAFLLRSNTFLEACKRASRGTTNRKRLKEELFLEEVVPLPGKTLQTSIIKLVSLLELVQREIASAGIVLEKAIPGLANFMFR